MVRRRPAILERRGKLTMKKVLIAAVFAVMAGGAYAADFADLQAFKASDVKVADVKVVVPGNAVPIKAGNLEALRLAAMRANEALPGALAACKTDECRRQIMEKRDEIALAYLNAWKAVDTGSITESNVDEMKDRLLAAVQTRESPTCFEKKARVVRLDGNTRLEALFQAEKAEFIVRHPEITEFQDSCNTQELRNGYAEEALTETYLKNGSLKDIGVEFVIGHGFSFYDESSEIVGGDLFVFLPEWGGRQAIVLETVYCQD
jgi:hypothetical protein